jgi:hypothetical protein
LFYTIEPLRIPFTTEVVEVAGITSAFLKTYFEEIFFGDTDAILTDFVTERLDEDSFGFNQPYGVNYTSMAVFSIESSFILTPEELDGLLSEAFLDMDLAIYLGLLQSLPSTNIFSTTSDVIETKVLVPAPAPIPRPGPVPRPGPSSSTIPIAAGAGAGAFALIIRRARQAR